MFGSRYFGGRHFGARFWARGSSTPPVPGKDWGPRYFGGRYWGPRFFPGGAAPSSLPANLMAAIEAAADADAALAGIGGGFWRGKLPPTARGAAPPTTYCVFTRTRLSHLMLTSTSEWKDATVRFRVYASDPDQAEALGEALAGRVRKWGALQFQGGYSIPAIEIGGLSDPTKDRRTGDKAAWYTEATFSFRFRRGRG